MDDVPAPVALLRMMTGYWVSKSLSVAAELGLADMLRAGREQQMSWPSRAALTRPSLYRLLRALVGVFTETPVRRSA